jgi:hypothetical protein
MGSLRLVIDTVSDFRDGEDVERQGIVVQEYAGEWQDRCPLTDAHFILPVVLPVHWNRASKQLRDLIERGTTITLDMERAALRGEQQ